MQVFFPSVPIQQLLMHFPQDGSRYRLYNVHHDRGKASVNCVNVKSGGMERFAAEAVLNSRNWNITNEVRAFLNSPITVNQAPLF